MTGRGVVAFPRDEIESQTGPRGSDPRPHDWDALPRMLLRHPLLALAHLFESLR